MPYSYPVLQPPFNSLVRYGRPLMQHQAETWAALPATLGPAVGTAQPTATSGSSPVMTLEYRTARNVLGGSPLPPRWTRTLRPKLYLGAPPPILNVPDPVYFDRTEIRSGVTARITMSAAHTPLNAADRLSVTLVKTLTARLYSMSTAAWTYTSPLTDPAPSVSYAAVGLTELAASTQLASWTATLTTTTVSPGTTAATYTAGSPTITLPPTPDFVLVMSIDEGWGSTDPIVPLLPTITNLDVTVTAAFELQDNSGVSKLFWEYEDAAAPGGGVPPPILARGRSLGGTLARGGGPAAAPVLARSRNW